LPRRTRRESSRGSLLRQGLKPAPSKGYSGHLTGPTGQYDSAVSQPSLLLRSHYALLALRSLRGPEPAAAQCCRDASHPKQTTQAASTRDGRVSISSPWQACESLNPGPSESLLGSGREASDRMAFATVSAHFHPTSRWLVLAAPRRRPGASLGIMLNPWLRRWSGWDYFHRVARRLRSMSPNSLVIGRENP